MSVGKKLPFGAAARGSVFDSHRGNFLRGSPQAVRNGGQKRRLPSTWGFDHHAGGEDGPQALLAMRGDAAYQGDSEANSVMMESKGSSALDGLNYQLA